MNLLPFISGALLLAYPLAVFAGMTWGGMKPLGLALIALFLLRMASGHFSKNNDKKNPLKHIAILTGAVGITLVSLSYIFKEQAWFLYYPVAVNTLMFALFTHSLWQKQSLIEQFARLQEPNLSSQGVHYTRNVTQVWCVFFIINGAIALFTCFRPLADWTLYNGLISYLFAGTLFVVEWFIRKKVRAS